MTQNIFKSPASKSKHVLKNVTNTNNNASPRFKKNSKPNSSSSEQVTVYKETIKDLMLINKKLTTNLRGLYQNNCVLKKINDQLRGKITNLEGIKSHLCHMQMMNEVYRMELEDK